MIRFTEQKPTLILFLMVHLSFAMVRLTIWAKPTHFPMSRTTIQYLQSAQINRPNN